MIPWNLLKGVDAAKATAWRAKCATGAAVVLELAEQGAMPAAEAEDMLAAFGKLDQLLVDRLAALVDIEARRLEVLGQAQAQIVARRAAVVEPHLSRPTPFPAADAFTAGTLAPVAVDVLSHVISEGNVPAARRLAHSFAAETLAGHCGPAPVKRRPAEPMETVTYVRNGKEQS